MIQMPKDISPRDISQWLSRGWFFYSMEADPDEKDLKIGMMNTFPERKRSPFLVRDLKETKNIRVDGPAYKKVFPHWPACGAINLVRTRFATVVERLQRQQYRRTYNSGCVTVTTPRAWDIGKIRPEATQIEANTPELVECCFYPQYFSVSELPTLWRDGWLSVAINPHIVVFHDPEKDDLVYYRGGFAGYLRDGNVFEPVDLGSTKRIARHLKDEVVII